MDLLYLFRCLFVLQRRREECERKARRGEMDPRLEYTFQLLIDATGLSRGELMDYIFDGNMVCLPLHSHPFMKSGLRNLYSDLHRLICKSVMKWSFNNLKIWDGHSSDHSSLSSGIWYVTGSSETSGHVYQTIHIVPWHCRGTCYILYQVDHI